ncbi:hypothetical protein LJR219_000850 [Phenylobacterium sp. LjRoot219]|uniref:hypothetical protein n=1 Tax=Phenylobacterium sp. LjRoot219 TaxID=3342283 RepID=UPI003ED0294A
MTMVRALTTAVAIDSGLLLRLRSLGLACGLATSFAFPLALSPLLDPSQADCFAHWSYAVGELLALLASFTIGFRRAPSTVLANGLLTIPWAIAVGANCHLWIALWTGETMALPHAM